MMHVDAMSENVPTILSQRAARAQSIMFSGTLCLWEVHCPFRIPGSAAF